MVACSRIACRFSSIAFFRNDRGFLTAITIAVRRVYKGWNAKQRMRRPFRSRRTKRASSAKTGPVNHVKTPNVSRWISFPAFMQHLPNFSLNFSFSALVFIFGFKVLVGSRDVKYVVSPDQSATSLSF